MITYTLKVIETRYEFEDALTICFKQPGLRKINYKAGQYLTIIVNINNRKYKRPYSLSSAPGIDDTLNITIKRLSKGIVSNHLIDVTKVGDVFEVLEPMGDFVYENSLYGDNQEIFLWGAGSGITPLMSILKKALDTSTQKINLFYCNKKLKQTIFYEQLISFKKKYENRFLLEIFLTEEENENARHGRINKNDVNKFLTNVTDLRNTIHYICGPIGLKDMVKNELTKQGIIQHQILSEDFEHIINANELEEIQTRFVGIVNGNEIFNIEVVRGKSILEAALDSQIDLPYSCQTGSCTLCKAKLITGEVKKIGNQVPDHEIDNNERLLCCSYPLSDDIIVKID